MDTMHYYEVNLLWNPATQRVLNSCENTQKQERLTHAGYPTAIKEKWTPEHQYIAVVNACLMSAFLLISGNSKFRFISFESNAVGKIEKVGGKMTVTEIVLKPKLTIPSTQNETRAKRMLEISRKACAITDSLKTKIILEPSLMVKLKDHEKKAVKIVDTKASKGAMNSMKA